MRPALPILLTAVAVALGACGSDGQTAQAPPPQAGGTTPPTSATETTPATTADAATATTVPDDGGTCEKVDAPAAKAADVAQPTGTLPTDRRTLVTLKTSCGSIVIEVDATAHPITANGFASLAKDGYYDGTIFHRIVPGWVIQGGDPTGTGSGGPSWRLQESPGDNATYPVGTVAMAKTATEGVGAFSSQFFIVTGNASAFSPDYAIAGKVVKGQAVANRIAALGAAGYDGPPSQTVELEKATVREK